MARGEVAVELRRNWVATENCAGNWEGGVVENMYEQRIF
jgi:hypothetical protein